LQVKDNAKNDKLALPHWEAFDANGLSVYAPKRPDPSNPAKTVGCQVQPLTTLGEALKPFLRLNSSNDFKVVGDAYTAWLAVRDELNMDTFNPEELKPIERASQASPMGIESSTPVTTSEVDEYFVEV
jgi:hypothetical protein